jgi:transposase
MNALTRRCQATHVRNPHSHTPRTTADGVCLIRLGVNPRQVASSVHIGQSTAYRWAQNLGTYHAPHPPRRGHPGRKPALSIADEEALLQWIRAEGWPM